MLGGPGPGRNAICALPGVLELFLGTFLILREAAVGVFCL